CICYWAPALGPSLLRRRLGPVTEPVALTCTWTARAVPGCWLSETHRRGSTFSQACSRTPGRWTGEHIAPVDHGHPLKEEAADWPPPRTLLEGHSSKLEQ